MSDMPEIDVRLDHWEIVRNILQKHLPNYEVWAFGSRAKWTAKEYSDLDLAVITDIPLSLEVMTHVSDDLSESDLPWRVDIIDWATTSESFRKIIAQDKVVVQRKAGGKWRLGFLDELVDFTPKRVLKKGVMSPHISMADLTENTRNISCIGQKEFSGGGSKFKNGDTIFARITPCLQNGKTAKVSGLKYDVIAHGSTEFIVLGAKYPDFDQDYIYYLSRLPEFRSFAISVMQGSTGRQRVSWQDLAQYQFIILPKNERRIIGKFLSSFDDKIELNRQMNQTLEQMAQALFKSWFVDFDPVIDNALDSGNAIPEPLQGRAQLRQSVRTIDNFKPLPQDIRQLFPNEFEESELGWIPKGWTEIRLTEFIKFANGKSHKGLQYGDIPLYGANGIIGYVNNSKYNNGIIIGRVGAYCGAIEYCAGDFWASDNTIVAIPKNGIEFNPYILMLLIFLNLNKYSGGAAQPLLNQTTLGMISTPNIDVVIQKLFCQIVGEYFKKIVFNKIQIQTLTKIRDTLLPKLISGELSLADIDINQELV